MYTSTRKPFHIAMCATQQYGFSLVEMMISIAIGLAIIAGLVGVLASNSGNSKTNERTSELQGNGRYALDHLRRELRHADYRGYTWATPNVPGTAIAITNECLAAGATAGSFVTHLSQGVWAANDSNPFAANCISSGYLRGDVLVIRRVASAGLASPIMLASNNLYFRSTFTKGEMFMAGASAVATTGAPNNVDGTSFGSPLADFLVQEYVYYIGGDDVDANIPALRRLTLVGNAMVDEMVLSGIEHMQVQFGRAIITPTVPDMQYFNASQISNDTEWEDVSSVRVWLLARNTKAEATYVNTNTYSMGDVVYDPADDGFRRQVFTSVVQLRNFHLN